MIKKQELKDGTVKVTFELEHLEEADKVQLLGDFNDWTPETMKKYKNGKHKSTVNLDPGNTYQFRYLVDGERWENDDEADRLLPTEFGVENSAVVC